MMTAPLNRPRWAWVAVAVAWSVLLPLTTQAAQAVPMGGNVAPLAPASSSAGEAPPPPPPPRGFGGFSGPGGASSILSIKPEGQAQPARTAATGAGVASATLPSPKIDLVNRAIDSTAPLTPKQIVEIRRKIRERQEAAYQGVTNQPPAKPVITQYRVDLSPGATPPIVRTQIGQGSVVNFVDAAGDPWPIVRAQNFNSPAIGVAQLDGHTLSVSLTNPDATGNIAVVLKNLASPVMLTVVPAQRETDYRVDMIVPKVFGRVLPPIGQLTVGGGPDLQTPLLGQFLLKIPPAGAKVLDVRGVDDVMAWQIGGGRMVLRTPYELSLPGFFNMTRSPDGTYVYLLQLTPRVQLMRNGDIATAVISGYDVESVAQNSLGAQR